MGGENCVESKLSRRGNIGIPPWVTVEYQQANSPIVAGAELKVIFNRTDYPVRPHPAAKQRRMGAVVEQEMPRRKRARPAIRPLLILVVPPRQSKQNAPGYRLSIGAEKSPSKTISGKTKVLLRSGDKVCSMWYTT